MRFHIIKPSAVLASYVENYWVLETDLSDGNVSERVIPTGNAGLMFHYKKPFIVNKKDFIEEQPISFVSGISSNYADVTTRGNSGVIAVTFYPYGASNFFPFPLNEIEDCTLNLDLLYSSIAKEVEEKIADFPKLQDKVKIIEQFLISSLNPINSHDLKSMQFAVNLIKSSKGAVDSNTLSDKLAMSTKSLERKFASYIGKTPRQFIRIIRFQKVIESIQNYRGNLTQLAYDYGYFDQAHFIKEFKQLSGYTPREYLERYPCAIDYSA